MACDPVTWITLLALLVTLLGTPKAHADCPITIEDARACLEARKKLRELQPIATKQEAELNLVRGQLIESRRITLDLRTELARERDARKNAEDIASAWYRSPWVWVALGFGAGFTAALTAP